MNNGGNSEVINSTEGVLYAEISALVDGGSNRSISVNDGSYNNYIVLRLSSNVGRFEGYIKSNGGALQSLSDYGNVQDNNNKIALVYNSSQFSIWVNGIKISTLVPTATPIGLNSFDFSWLTGDLFCGNTRDLKLYNTALTDAELASLTTI